MRAVHMLTSPFHRGLLQSRNTIHGVPMTRRPLVRLSWCVCLVVLILAPASAFAQSTELFFSEYIEGTSNNKALEIYNGTGAAVVLTGNYNIQMFFNGSTTATLSFGLTGTVAPGDVFVVAQGTASAAILAQADQTNTAGWFNGDDVVVLRKGTTIIDVIGQLGVDPGTEWGSGLTSTADNTLRRKSAITAGDPINNDLFDPSIEWDGFATDSFDGLGSHNADTPPPPPVMTATIPEIQGSGVASPFAGSARKTTGIVTAVFPTGFFIQDAAGDGNGQTSDGVFVFTGGVPTVAAGDEVEVVGGVTEFFDMTELLATKVTKTGSGSVPLPVRFDANT